MIKAKDVMSKNIMTVKEETSLKFAIKLLVENNITGLPVVSDEMDLMGIVTEKDILKSLYSSDVKSKTIADLMARDIISFDEDVDLIKIFKCLVENNFRRVPILSEGKLVGIISRRDIIKFLSRKITSPDEPEET